MKQGKLKGLILVLGSENSPEGDLSEIGISRLNRALEFYKAHPGYKLVCTGGFGAHFNTSKKPHAEYAKNYLISKHVPSHDILDLVMSCNTIEDAKNSIPVVRKYSCEQLVVITSDFHMERVKLIFKKFFLKENLFFVEAHTNLDEESLNKLRNHETNAIKRFMFENVD